MRTVVLALLVAASGCTADVRARPASFDPVALGSPCVERAASPEPAWLALTRPGVWARVASVDLGRRGGDRPFGGDYAIVGGDGDVAARIGDDVDRVVMPRDTAEAVDDALALGATVHVHLRVPPPGGDPRAGFAVAVTETDFAFLGRCAFQRWTAYLRERLGDGAAAQVRALVGKPSAAVRRVVAPIPAWAPQQPRRLAEVPAPERAGLRRGSFRLAAPAAFTGPYYVCSAVPQGWSGCVDVRTAATARRPATMHFAADGRSEVTFWLVGRDLDYSRPVARMAVVHPAAPAAGAGIDLRRDHVLLRLTVEGTPPWDQVVAHDGFLSRFVTYDLFRR